MSNKLLSLTEEEVRLLGMALRNMIHDLHSGTIFIGRDGKPVTARQFQPLYSRLIELRCGLDSEEPQIRTYDEEEL